MLAKTGMLRLMDLNNTGGWSDFFMVDKTINTPADLKGVVDERLLYQGSVSRAKDSFCDRIPSHDRDGERRSEVHGACRLCSLQEKGGQVYVPMAEKKAQFV